MPQHAPQKLDRLVKTTLSVTLTALRRLPVLSILFLSVLPTIAQRPAHYDQRNADLVNAMELFAKAKYGAAQFEMERVIDRIADRNDVTRNEAEFMSALCAVRLFHDDAGHKLLAFMDNHPENQRIPAVRFELFKHAFAKKDWKDALAWSDQVDRFKLDTEELEEYRFKRGYAYFQEGDQARALGEFAEVQNGTGT